MGLNGSTLEVSAYTVNDGNAGGNYTVMTHTHSGTITKAGLTATANDKSKTYGIANPSFDATITGFVGGEGLGTSGVTGSPVCSSTATTSSSVGNYPITCTTGTLAATNYSFGVAQGTLHVTTATLTVSIDNKSKQYSDPNPAPTVSFSGFVNGDTAAVVSGAPACSTIATSASGPGTYPITCSVGTLSAPNYTFAGFAPGTITVTQEDASVTYTGPMLNFTLSPTTYSANVTLAATVQDANDGSRGDVRNARVTFVVNGVPLTGSCANIMPGPLNPLDSTTGTVSCTTTLTIPSSQYAQEYQVGVQVGGFYLRNAPPLPDAIVTVALPTSNFLTGGGYLVMQNSAGTYQASPGTHTNFGFDIKYNKALTNLQGHVNIIFRAGSRTYQIKSTSLTSLGMPTPNPTLPVSSTNPATAVFVSKATLTDVTLPNNPISISGGLSLQISLTDRGDPGSQDSLAISLMNGPQLYYSSDWTGVNTVEQTLDGGNLAAH